MTMVLSSIRYIHIAALIGIVCLSGCQALWEPDPDFGSSVNDAIRLQAVNPDQPAKSPVNPSGMDGPAAKSSIDNYHYSFEQRPAASSGTGGGSGYGGMVMGNPASSQAIGGAR